MAYLGLSPEPQEGMACTMDMVEYINPSTGEITYGSSSCPPDGFVRADVYNVPKQKIDRVVQLTPQQIEAQVKQMQPAPTGGGLALAAIAAYLILGA